MERIEAERQASQHEGAIVARVVRDAEGRLVFDLPGGFSANGLRLIGPNVVEEGRFVVLVPAGDGIVRGK
jgi:hypothetical protein